MPKIARSRSHSGVAEEPALLCLEKTRHVRCHIFTYLVERREDEDRTFPEMYSKRVSGDRK